MAHYLDHAASTPVRPVAIERMLPLLRDDYGNPSGSHRMARVANRVLDDSREVVADALGCQPGEVVFTGGGTESDNLAVFGVIEMARQHNGAGKVICSAIEHHAVLDSVAHLGGSTVPVTPDGVVDLDALEGMLGSDVGLVSVMLVNNEIGVVQPLPEIVELVRRVAPTALIHTDAVQAVSWLDLTQWCAGVDLISISGHKFGGPKGVGALAVRPSASLVPRSHGGGQERERRGGTQNVPGIAAMAAAIEETVATRGREVERIGALRRRLVEAIIAGLEPSGVSTHVTGVATATTPNIAHLCFDDIENEALLFLLEKDDVMASAASSCSSGAMEPSHVLAAMNVPRERALGSLRLSLGYTSTEADIDAAIAAVTAAVRRLSEGGS